MLKDSSLPAKTKLEIMQAIDSGEVLDGNPEAYDCAKGHLQFFAENLPLFGQENLHTWIRRITGGGSGTLTNKRDSNAIKTDMTDEEYEAAGQVSEGFYDTAAQLNREKPRTKPLTLYRGIVIPAMNSQGAAGGSTQLIAGYSDVLPSSASWQRTESIKMSEAGEGQSAVLMYMTVPPLTRLWPCRTPTTSKGRGARMHSTSSRLRCWWLPRTTGTSECCRRSSSREAGSAITCRRRWPLVAERTSARH